tara:strand:+ start:413 stop:841 length:429 start_codon:yes stop_codon:yes gene_type:complete
LESHPYAFSVVVDFVVVLAAVVVVPPPFSSSFDSEAEEADLDFARRNDSSAVTVKRVRFETSPRVTSESLPSVVVVVVAFSLDYCALAPSCFSRLGNRKRRSRYSLGKTKDEENKVQNLLSDSHSVSTPFNGKKRQEMFSDV